MDTESHIEFEIGDSSGTYSQGHEQIWQRRYPQHFLGREYLRDMARIYSESRFFDLSAGNGIEMRVFEPIAILYLF